VTTFVSVGNAKQPFRRLLDVIVTLAKELPQPVVVQHGNSPFSATGCVLRPFMDMVEFTECVRRSELIISHAGAGSIIHAIRAGKIPVVMPRIIEYDEIVDDHQLELAQAFAKLGKVVMVEEQKDFRPAIAEALHKQAIASGNDQSPPIVEILKGVLCAIEANAFSRSEKENS
jgi:UDP-N-acetylglucosamine transferase subunit ALG13